MNRILTMYQEYVRNNGNIDLTGIELDEYDMININSLLETVNDMGIFSVCAYDELINLLCDYGIEVCYTCGKYDFIENLAICENCDEFICAEHEGECQCKEPKDE